MSNFMGNNIYSAFVTSEKGRGDECEARILHTTIWERGRKDKQIVATPFIRSQQ
jgi:hypothetical protein